VRVLSPMVSNFATLYGPRWVNRNAVLDARATVLEQVAQSERIATLGVTQGEVVATRDREVDRRDVVACEVCRTDIDVAANHCLSEASKCLCAPR
jgi:hypothetical protein